MPETKVKKRRKTAFEDLDGDSDSDFESDEESDTEKEQQPTQVFSFADGSERLIDIDTSNKERQHEAATEARPSPPDVDSSEEHEASNPGATLRPGVAENGLLRSGRV